MEHKSFIIFWFDNARCQLIEADPNQLNIHYANSFAADLLHAYLCAKWANRKTNRNRIFWQPQCPRVNKWRRSKYGCAVVIEDFHIYSGHIFGGKPVKS